MPFQSEKQRRYLWANEPEIARDWADTYGSRIKKDDGGIARLGYLHGGVTHPDGRRGFFTGAEKDSREKGTNISPGTSGRTSRHGPTTRDQDRGPKDDMTIRQHFQTLPGTGEKDTKDVVKASKRIDDRKFNFREKIYHSGLKRNKVEAMRQLNLMRSGMPGLWGKLISGMTGKVPEWAEDLTEAELMQIATSGPYLSQQKSKWDASQFGKGKDLLGRVTEGQDLLNKGNLTQSDWDRLFPSNITPPRDGGGGYMGYPSYAAWKAAQGQGGTTEVAEVVEDTPSAFQASLTGTADTPDYYVGDNPLASNIAWGKQMGVDPRTMGLTSFAADGGRIPRAYGGIMDTATGRRAYGLGSIFKSIKKAAGKVLKSPIGKAALIGGAGWLLGGGGIGSWKGFGGKGFGWETLRNRPMIKQLLTKKGEGDAWDWGKVAIAGAGALPFFMGGEKDEDDNKFDYEGAKNAYQDELMRIKAGSMAGSLDPNKFSYLPTYKEGGRIGLQEGGDPILREEYKKYVFEMEEMNLIPMTFEEFKAQARAGMYAGGQSIPSEYTMEDAMMTTTQDKLGGITDVMKQADLNRKGSVGQFYAADGGRIGYAGGTEWTADAGRFGEDPEFSKLVDDAVIREENKYLRKGKIPSPFLGEKLRIQMWNDYKTGAMGPAFKAQGGRIGYAGGSGRPPITMGQIQAPAPAPNQPPQRPNPMPAPQPNRMGGMPGGMNPMGGGMNPMMAGMHPMMNRPMMNPMGGRRRAQEGGLMDLGGMEKDYRQEGGFVPLGGEEKADDVPARLSKNEFVFTADAVRGAGDGDIDKGAEIMENIMKNLEQGGQISEETQGLSGAQEMFGVSERLGEVL